MSYPIQRQCDTYGVFDDGDLRFAKEYTTRDLPPGLANALGGPRITAGMNNPGNRRQAWGPGGENEYGPPGPVEPAWTRHEDSPEANGYDPRQDFYNDPEPTHENYDAYREPPETQLQPLHDMLEHHYRPDPVAAPSRDYVAQFSPHAPSFKEARLLEAEEGGPAPGLFTPLMFQPRPGDPRSTMLDGEKAFINDQPVAQGVDWVTAAVDPDWERKRDEILRAKGPSGLVPPGRNVDFDQSWPEYGGSHVVNDALIDSTGPAPMGDEDYHHIPLDLHPSQRLNTKTALAISPQVVPGWVGHGYVPGHRVGLPWRDQLIPGTVTHLDGQEVGVRWDDGQHSSEEAADLRPL